MKRVKEGAKWTWSALRPGAVIGFSLVRTRTSSTHPSTPWPHRKHGTARCIVCLEHSWQQMPQQVAMNRRCCAAPLQSQQCS